MRALVTGAAGFVGSTLVEHLLGRGWEVRGVDAFTDYYDPLVKRKNLESVKGNSHAELIEADLLATDLRGLVDNVDVVFHLAAQPGVRMSWSDDFATYARANVLATQLLLEAVRGSRIDRFVYASSSSVYGNSAPVPTPESSALQPYSPYGVTKLAAEQLCVAYAANFGVPTVSLRYFTVFGPRQRPDMAIHRMIEASLTGDTFRLFGDGSQVRDFTFVDDIVAATAAAARAELAPGEIFNVAGGSSTTVNELLGRVESATGKPLHVTRQSVEAGDVRATGASIERAMSRLGYRPSVSLDDGLERQVAFHRGTHPEMAGTGSSGLAATIHSAVHATRLGRVVTSTHWVALIPMRKGSRGLPGKNTRLLAGLPLYMHSVRHAHQAGFDVVITTDIDDLEDPPDGVAFHKRPSELGSDSTLMQEVVADVLEKTISSDAVVVLLQPTSPLRTMSAIAECRAAFESGSYSMVMTVTDAPSAANKYGAVEEGVFRPLSTERLFGNRQDLPLLSRPNGAVYVFRAADFISCGGFPADRVGVVRMAEEDSIDIDTMADFARVESRLASRHEGDQ